MFAALLPILGGIVQTVVQNVFPNPEDELKRLQLEQQMQIALAQQAADLEKAAADNVKAEVQSTHWLAANWRPICMLTFCALIVARFMGYTAPGLGEGEAMELWAIVKVGLGGYTVGRTVEKVAPTVARAFKK